MGEDQGVMDLKEAASNPPTTPLISMQDVAKHNKKEDCWVVIHGRVYDLTKFIDSHPGGVGPILAKAGLYYNIICNFHYRNVSI